MLLAEIIFNRELIKKEHPMYDRFWLVTWLVQISPKDLIALWVFPNKEEWELCTQSRKTERVRDLIKEKYPGDYFISFKSDNGVHMAAIMSFDYVHRHGNTVSVAGASFTEKSAIGAAKKAVEDKGHHWGENDYSVISVVPRDPAIFKLDPDEDIDTIHESIVSQALMFADYVGETVESEKVRADFMKLGKALFRDGWTFYYDRFSPRFSKADPSDEQDGVMGWTITFPLKHDAPSIRSGLLDTQWSGMKMNSMGEWVLCHYHHRESAESINERWGLETFKQFLYQAAKPPRT